MEEDGNVNDNGGDVVAVEQVISQKDIQDFWDHVSTDERISDVCLTFEAESKQVISKLFAKTASLPEKFAVANFLLQVGALKFQVQSSPTEPNVYHTVIILQKPDPPSQTGNDAEAPPEQETVDDADDAECNMIKEECPMEESLQEEGEDGDFDGDATKEEEQVLEEQEKQKEVKEEEEEEQEEEEEAAPEDQAPWVPEHHECSACGDVLESPWDLDLHLLDDCQPFPVRMKSKKHKGRRSKKEIQWAKDKELSRKKLKVEVILGVSESGKESSEKGTAEEKKEDSAKEEDKTEDYQVEVTRTGRVRRIPVKFQDTVKHKDSFERRNQKAKGKRGNTPDQDLEKEGKKDDLVDGAVSGSPKKRYGNGYDRVMCDFCSKPFQRDYLAKHITVMHREAQEFKCKTCDKKFSIKGIFRNHVMWHRNLATRTLFPCDACDSVFALQSRLRLHTSLVHEKKRIKCDHCDRTFANPAAVERHKKKVAMKIKKTYPCTLCDKVFNANARLKDHLIVHSGKKDFKCDICGMEFFHKQGLRSHQKVHVEGKPYLCAICGAGYKSKTTLNQHHLTAHTEDRKYQCRTCNKRFSRSSLRNQHEKVHEGANPFPCDICHKSFRDKYKLQVHVNWHMGVRPFECKVCHKFFLIKGNLTKHTRLHTGERPYVCSECGRGCVDSSQLKKHLSQNHNILVARTLTKGPERDLPSKPSKSLQPNGTSKEAGDDADKESFESQAYTIATDALIEISQQVVESMPIPVEGGQVIVASSSHVGPSGPQQVAAGEVVSTTVESEVVEATAADDNNVFPIMLQVSAQDNQVAVPVTESINLTISDSLQVLGFP